MEVLADIIQYCDTDRIIDILEYYGMTWDEFRKKFYSVFGFEYKDLS